MIVLFRAGLRVWLRLSAAVGGVLQPGSRKFISPAFHVPEQLALIPLAARPDTTRRGRGRASAG